MLGRQYGSQRDGLHRQLRESAASAVPACQVFPPQTQAENHTAAYAQCPHVVRVAPFRNTHPGVEGDRTLDDRKTVGERRVQEVTVELMIYTTIEYCQQSWQRFAPDHFVRCSYIGESALTYMLELKQFAGEEIPVIHKSRKLRVVCAKLLNNSRAINNFRVPQICGEFIKVEGSESTVSLAQYDIRVV